MNRYARRRAEAQQRAYEARLRKDAEGAASNTSAIILPDDIKRDIAKTVRSIDWALSDGTIGGMCFFRAMSGWFTLKQLELPATPALGGMIYRAGTDERRDVLSFCGPDNIGTIGRRGLLAHYFIVSDNDIVDFSVGDWKMPLPDVEVLGVAPLEPIQWTASPPEFFWDDRSNFLPDPAVFSPELGRAWYTGFSADRTPDVAALVEEQLPTLRRIQPHLAMAFEHYALKERVWAVIQPHLAMAFEHYALKERVWAVRIASRAARRRSGLAGKGEAERTADRAPRQG
jgi:hypothetical protein